MVSSAGKNPISQVQNILNPSQGAKKVVQKKGEKKKRNVSTRIETIAGGEVTIFTPTRTTPTAKAIFIHGGAWCFSDVKSFSPFIATLVV